MLISHIVNLKQVGRVFYRKDGKFLPDYTVSDPRTQCLLYSKFFSVLRCNDCVNILI